MPARIKGRKSSEIEKELGLAGRDELIHRDDLVMMAGSAMDSELDASPGRRARKLAAATLALAPVPHRRTRHLPPWRCDPPQRCRHSRRRMRGMWSGAAKDLKGSLPRPPDAHAGTHRSDGAGA
jgi:hypothetical protein